VFEVDEVDKWDTMISSHLRGLSPSETAELVWAIESVGGKTASSVDGYFGGRNKRSGIDLVRHGSLLNIVAASMGSSSKYENPWKFV
jgi:hypothetical protein